MESIKTLLQRAKRRAAESQSSQKHEQQSSTVLIQAIGSILPIANAPLIEQPFSLAPLPPTFSLQPFKLDGVNTAYYVPNFITQAEECAILDYIIGRRDRWVQLKRRALQQYGGQPSSEGLQRKEPLPDFGQALAQRLFFMNLFPIPPNHLLVNRYAPTEGIMHHKDGCLYFPQVAIISLNDCALLKFTRDVAGSNEIGNIFTQPHSLTLFSGELYSECFHTIEEIENVTITDKTLNKKTANVHNGEVFDRTRMRYSLTLRLVDPEYTS